MKEFLVECVVKGRLATRFKPRLSRPFVLPSQSDEVVNPLSWSISDGLAADTLTNGNHTYLFAGFEFRTDASGNISAWAVGANDGPNTAFSWVANFSIHFE